MNFYCSPFENSTGYIYIYFLMDISSNQDQFISILGKLLPIKPQKF